MRAFNIGFIVLFAALLLVPLVCIDLTRDRVSAEENRMLVNPPELADVKINPRTFIRHFEEWFKDSTGFREQCMALYNVYAKNIWFGGNVYLDGQFVMLAGEQGHHYNMDNNGRLLQKFQGKPWLSGDQLSAMAIKLEAVKIYLDKKNIPFTVMLCADKETIYPEYVPKSIERGPEPVQLDVITQYLKEHTGVDVFNIRQALLKEKNNYLLYPLIDTRAYYHDFLHYNEIGAFFAYRELMNHINRYFPDIVPYEVSDIAISYNPVGIPSVSLKTEKTYKKLDASFFDDVDYVKMPVFNDAYENTDSDGPVGLFFYDSYGLEWAMGKYLAQHFREAVFIHWSKVEYLDKLVSRYKPDMVVFESAERGLDLFAGCIAGIPELPAEEQ